MNTQGILGKSTVLAGASLVSALALAGWSGDARAAQTIAINGQGAGRTYDGVGAVSGGGATSVLLPDYVEPQRSQILDFLFKPSFGAGLQELYVEIGGDGNSTQGSELSHMHSRTDENYHRGYEWWLMKEARSRNPRVFLDPCAWSVPGWVGNGNFWSQDTADYLAKWLLGAKSVHGLDIDFVGCRNERGVNTNWVKTFRSTLDKNGLTNVKIHAFDNWQPDSWDWTGQLSTDTQLNNAVYALGNHITCSSNPPPASVQALAKPLWDTEEHVYEHGFQCEIDIVKCFIENYIKGKITKTINWYMVTSYYEIEGFYDTTMMLADQPWSGYYKINPALWAYAHMTQFVQPGWKFIDAATVRLTGGGAVASFVSPGGSDYSIVLETQGANAAQGLTFTLSGGLSTGKVSVWRSNSSQQFVKQADITPTNGSFTLSAEANSVYSMTTTTGQQKGTGPAPPAAARFPFPYHENYDHYPDLKKRGYRPYYHADIAGGFELADRPDGKGQCLRQVVSQPAQSWAQEGGTHPFTVLGDTGWTDFEVSVDVSVENTGWASVLGRVTNTGNGWNIGAKGYMLTLSNTGAWAFTPGTAKGQATLATGSWHNLKLVFQGNKITGSIDGTEVFSVTDGTYGKGCIGLGSQTRTTALFDNLIVKTVGAATPSPTVFPQDSQVAPDGGVVSPDAGPGGGGGSGGGAGDAGVAAGGARGGGGSTGAGGGSGSGGPGGTVGSGGSAAPGAGGVTGGSVGAGGMQITGGGGGGGGGGKGGQGGQGGEGGEGGAAGNGGAGGGRTTAGGNADGSGCSCNLGGRDQRGLGRGGLLLAFLLLLARRAAARAG